ncbi:hypothetical protein BGZ99_007877 [Dissophora globulifera]|uniref:Uncharacterized protein n=1 Tax=Dissophora globulifera TaxID=979702 RepID=A0A9P6R875_9FUNG|nr:hypothetical protein BGZ99_007877 [Dissophora globulifera]
MGMTESFQEIVAFVWTPGPTDSETEASTPEVSLESMLMDADDVPQVKKVHPGNRHAPYNRELASCLHPATPAVTLQLKYLLFAT